MHTSARINCFSFRLDDEWTHLRTDRRSLQRARSWGVADPDHPLAAVTSGLCDLAQIVAATQRAAGNDDAILHRLVELGRTDDLAARIVLQRLVPGLISRAARYRSFADDVDPVEIVVPAAWLAIRRFDTERRRHHIAASLISDAVFEAFRRQLRRQSSTEIVRSPQRFSALVGVDPAVNPIEELASVIRDATSAGVPSDDIELLRRLAQVDSPLEVARERNVSPRTIRYHRTRAIASVRSAVAA